MTRVITSTASEYNTGANASILSAPQGARRKPATPSGAALLAAILILIVSIFHLDIPYFAITPGPAIDVVELIEIGGAKTKPVSGRLLLTTVSLHQIKVAEAIRGWFDSSYEVLSWSTIIPSGETEKDADQRSSVQMQESHEHAAAAALSFLGYEVKKTWLGARVRDLAVGAPAEAVLRRGDIIVGADSKSVKRAEDLVAAIKRHKVGDHVVLKVKRGQSTLTVKTKTMARAEDPSEPIIGVVLDTVPRVDLPLAVQIDSLDIGGPSAGLMYALGIVDLLDSADLARGRTVAGTGEISVEGVVKPVGGVTQKIAGAKKAGADIFLVPASELEAACASADDLEVYAVAALADAVRVLRDAQFAAGRACP